MEGTFGEASDGASKSCSLQNQVGLSNPSCIAEDVHRPRDKNGTIPLASYNLGNEEVGNLKPIEVPNEGGKETSLDLSLQSKWKCRARGQKPIQKSTRKEGQKKSLSQ